MAPSVVTALCLAAAVGACVTPVAAQASAPPPPRIPTFPWPYDNRRFPAAWFGANMTGPQTAADITDICRYSLSILGWQHAIYPSNFTAIDQAQLKQASVIHTVCKAPAFVYLPGSYAPGLWSGIASLLADNATYADYFIQHADGPASTLTYCSQVHADPTEHPNCRALFFNWCNASAVSYYVDHVLEPLAAEAAARGVTGVFVDNCDQMMEQAVGAVNVPSVDAAYTCMVNFQVAVTTKLNQHGLVPLLSEFGKLVSFYKPTPPQPVGFFNESAAVKALQPPLLWMRFYEFFVGAEAMSFNFVSNRLREAAAGVPSLVHHYTTNTSQWDTTSIAAFLMAYTPYSYYLSSSGWLDADFKFLDVFRRTYGTPLSPAVATATGWYRPFTHVNASVDCTNATACVGALQFY